VPRNPACWELRPIWNLTKRSIPFAVSDWILQLRTIVNPLAVGIMLGPEAVGIVALGLRLVAVIGFVRDLVRRLAFAGLRQMTNDRRRMMRFIEAGTEVQVFLVGASMLLFSIALPVLIERGLGKAWQGIVPIFPLIAAGFVISTAPSVAANALAVLRRNLIVNTVSALQSVVLLAVCAALASTAGIAAYGIGEMIAACLAIAVVPAMVREVGRPRWLLPCLTTLAFVAALMSPYLGPWAFAPLSLMFILPTNWRAARRYLVEFRGRNGVPRRDATRTGNSPLSVIDFPRRSL
jgi:O-antigen/teichoic acid export membrane protein